jgi:N-acetylmuramoyl-L-alanine amidase
MKKRLLSLLMCVMILAAVSAPSLAANGYNEVSIYIDNQYTELSISAILIDGSTYVPLRAFSNALGAYDVGWGNRTATISGNGLYAEASIGSNYVIANDRYLYSPNPVRLINDSTMVPVRPLVAAFDGEVEWEGSTRSVYVTTGSGAITSGSSFYNSDDVYWLSRIIQAEAGNESMTGKIAVGNVIMNRVASPLCPNNIYDVIFDFSNGIQFTPAYTGSIYCTPSYDSIVAAKIALEGYSVVGDSLFFASTTDCWAAYNRPYVTTIGNHYFYA